MRDRYSGAFFAVGPKMAFVAAAGVPAVTVDSNILDGGRSLRPTLLVRIAGDVVTHGNLCRSTPNTSPRPRCS